MRGGGAAKIATAATVAKTVEAATKRRGSLRRSGVFSLLWGAGLLWQGPKVFSVVQGHEPEPVDDDAITVLAVRYLAQGTVQIIAPRMFGPLYAGIDLLHAASMVALAVRQPHRRRAAAASGAIAAISALVAIQSSRKRSSR